MTKPCPFCGVTDDHTDRCYFTLKAGGATVGELSVAWNRRATPPSPSTAPTVEVDAVRLLAAIVQSDIGIATRHKLEDGQGIKTEDGKSWLAAIQFVADLASKPPAREAAERQSIEDDNKFHELLANHTRAACLKVSAKKEKAALIAHIDTWGGAAPAAGNTEPEE